MKNFLLFLTLFFITNVSANYSNDFDSGSNPFQSDYAQHPNNGCAENQYTLTDSWNFGTCIKLPANRTGDGTFMMFENDPNEPTTGKLYYGDVITTSEGSYNFRIDVNHRNFTWGSHQLRDIPLLLYIDNNFIHEFEVPLQDVQFEDDWVTLEHELCLTAGNHFFELRQDFSITAFDDDFAIDNIIISQNYSDVEIVLEDGNGNVINEVCWEEIGNIRVRVPEPGISYTSWTLAVAGQECTHDYYGPLSSIPLQSPICDLDICPGDVIEISLDAYFPDNCPPISVNKSYTVQCCDMTLNPGFSLNTFDIDANSYEITTALHSLDNLSANGCPSTHLWCIYESNELDGDYALVDTQTGTQGLSYIATKEKYYKVVHKIESACGNFCHAKTVYQQEGFLNNLIAIDSIYIDCDVEGCPSLDPPCVCPDPILTVHPDANDGCRYAAEALVTVDTTCTIIGVLIEFGDGNTVYQEITGTGPSYSFGIVHNYTQNGNYTINLTFDLLNPAGDTCQYQESVQAPINNCNQSLPCICNVGIQPGPLGNTGTGPFLEHDFQFVSENCTLNSVIVDYGDDSPQETLNPINNWFTLSHTYVGNQITYAIEVTLVVTSPFGVECEITRIVYFNVNTGTLSLPLKDKPDSPSNQLLFRELLIDNNFDLILENQKVNNAKLSLFNINGILISEKIINSGELVNQVSNIQRNRNLSSGIYVMRLQIGDQYFVDKIVISN